MKIFIILTIFVVIFEVFLREIELFSFISLYFVIFSILFWFKRYKALFILGFASGFLIDIILQDNLGKSSLSLFLPLLILSLIDSLVRVESKLSRILFSIGSLILSIGIHDYVFNLFMFSRYIDLKVVGMRILASAILMSIIIFVFQKPLASESEGSEKKIRSRYV